MKVEQFFKEWISTRPNLKSEFHDVGIEAMAFADAYHKKQLRINVVMSRLPDSDEIRQQAQQMDEKEFDQWWWETVYKAN